ncbi:hypothetical protein [Carboxylicivirga marina]|uniref:hypothetical protein n=1 Tax=Carboxylicivirga marina TaxID=2800988 RepID=UPI0025924601|nr:hypothetical protein [uncultured Carboxylicivirga sp.]
MRTQKDRDYAKKRKKLWDAFDWKYASTNALSKNHSLRCGCKWCAMERYHKWFRNKRNRIDAREALSNVNDLRIYEVNKEVKSFKL